MKKPKHLRGEVGGPVLAELDVTAVFGRVMPDHADRKVSAETKAPDEGEGGDQRAAHRPTGAEERVETGDRTKRVGPRDVDDAVVVESARDEVEQREEEAERAEGDENEGGRRHERRVRIERRGRHGRLVSGDEVDRD